MKAVIDWLKQLALEKEPLASLNQNFLAARRKTLNEMQSLDKLSHVLFRLKVIDIGQDILPWDWPDNKEFNFAMYAARVRHAEERKRSLQIASEAEVKESGSEHGARDMDILSNKKNG
jgi:hypothetical protein